VVVTGVGTSGSTLTHTTIVTYAGSTLTRAIFGRDETAGGAVSRTELWYRINPTSGTNLVQITAANTTRRKPATQMAVSFLDTTGIGNVLGSTGASSNPSGALTLTTAGSWLVNAVKSNVAVPLTTVSGETIRSGSTVGTDFQGVGDVAPGSSGSNTYNWTGGSVQPWAMAALELLPSTFVAPVTGVPQLTLVGVGL